MTASILQNTSIYQPGGQSLAVLTLNGVTSGSTILILLGAFSDGGTAATVSDNRNGNYANLDYTGTAGTNNVIQTLAFENSVSGTIVITAAGSWNYMGMVALEIGGVPPTGAIIGHTASGQIPATTGTNVISIGPPTPNNTGPAFLVAGSQDWQGGGNFPVAGTGFVSYGTFIPLLGGPNNLVVETLQVSSASPAAKFSLGSGGIDIYLQFDVVFAESGGTPSHVIFDSMNE